MSIQKVIITGGAGAAVLLLAAAGSVLADSSVGVCAFTGNLNQPYQFVQVNQSDLDNYEGDHLLDIYGVSSAADCPATIRPVKGEGVATATPSPTPSPSPVGMTLGASTTKPTELPDTGAGLMGLLGVPAAGAVSGAYIHAKLSRR